MATDVYARLARHLDDLPAGFPATASGVEQRILRRLFSPEEAELALKLSLLEEEPRVIARRAGLPVEECARRLEEMARKGLIYRTQAEGKPARYMAIQFAIGIWEFQVNRLDDGLVHDFDEYLPDFTPFEVWKKAPQLRTIPVGESVDAQLTVLPYERAEEIVRKHSRLAVAPCICRREQRMVGHGCNKPLETCLVFGGAADYYLRNGLARDISQEEALEILKTGRRGRAGAAAGQLQRSVEHLHLLRLLLRRAEDLETPPRPGQPGRLPLCGRCPGSHLPGVRHMPGPLPDGGTAAGGRQDSARPGPLHRLRAVRQHLPDRLAPPGAQAGIGPAPRPPGRCRGGDQTGAGSGQDDGRRHDRDAGQVRGGPAAGSEVNPLGQA